MDELVIVRKEPLDNLADKLRTVSEEPKVDMTFVELMDEAILYAGKGSSTLYAGIGVTYPAGSTCTCTNGTVTYTAPDTTGRVIFSIPSTGTWTVIISNGTDSTDRMVNITAEGQFYSLNLNYGFIYKTGNMYEATTGGWVGKAWKAVHDATAAAAPTVTNTTNYLQIQLPNSVCEGVCHVVNDIDLTDISTIKIVFKALKTMNIVSVYLVVVERAKTCWIDGSEKASVQIVNNVILDTWTTDTLDVSDIVGEYDIVIGYRSLYYDGSYTPRQILVQSIELLS